MNKFFNKLQLKIQGYKNFYIKCSTDKDKCQFTDIQLKFQDQKFDYSYDDYSNNYQEAFWVSKGFQLLSPYIDIIQYPQTFENKYFMHYTQTQQIEIIGKKDDDNAEKPINFEDSQNSYMSLKLAKDTKENYESKCAINSDCQTICQQTNGIYQEINENGTNIPYCFRFEVFQKDIRSFLCCYRF